MGVSCIAGHRVVAEGKRIEMTGGGWCVENPQTTNTFMI